MTVEDYIEKLKAMPRTFETTPEKYAVIEEAVRMHPQSARLWCFKGALIQLGPDDGRYTLEVALACYRKAIEVAPEDPEGWEELGHYYDVLLNDEAEAQRMWRVAEELKKKKAEPGAPGLRP